MKPRSKSNGVSGLFRLFVPCLLAAFNLSAPLAAATTVLTAWSGSDGIFNTISMDGNTLYQAADQGGGNYWSFMYFRRPSAAGFPAGSTLYLEVDYKDTGGDGRLGCQYNAVGNCFQNAGTVLGASIDGTGLYKTAVMRLDNSDFQLCANGGNDLRLTASNNVQMHIREVRISDSPTAAYLAATAFLGPYTGPAYNQGTPVDSSTIQDKLYVGYQGWFRTPGDEDDMGWIHWTGSWGSLNTSLISEDFWPDMTEFTAAEKYAAPGFTYPGGAQAHLFSSDNKRTVLRHFQWMESYGIDGAALQRFTNWSGSPGIDGFRVMSHVREAANRTGRVWFIEYDMTGTNEADLVARIRSDWQYLVDTMQVTADDRYLHEGGRPVVAIHGWYRERFSSATANAVLDIFQSGGPYQAYVLASGEWYWDQAVPVVPEWNDVVYRMDAWLGWNAGNLVNNPPMAKTDYWDNNRTLLAAQGVQFVPELFPGASSYHRDGEEIPPLEADQFCPRRDGDFLWEQFATARTLGFTTVFLGMFDEFDEGTQIAKTTNSPPTQRSFLDYEGQPSDCYLCYAGQGIKMLRGEIPYTATRPNCSNLTQPSIPEVVAPVEGATVAGPEITFAWTQAFAAEGAAYTVTGYELEVDGTLYPTGALAMPLPLGAGAHSWRVRAVNSRGTRSGWSLKLPFDVVGETATLTASPTRSPVPSDTATTTATATPSAGASTTSSPSASETPTASRTATPNNSPSRTVSVTASPTFSVSSTRTSTATWSQTASATRSATRTLSSTPTWTRSASPTPTQVNTAVPFASVTPSPTLIASATPTVLPERAGRGPNRVKNHSMAPNPWNGEGATIDLYFELEGGADSVELGVYAPSTLRLGKWEYQKSWPGQSWQRLSLSADWLSGLPNGTYFYRVIPRRQGSAGTAALGSFVILR